MAIISRSVCGWVKSVTNENASSTLVMAEERVSVSVVAWMINHQQNQYGQTMWLYIFFIFEIPSISIYIHIYPNTSDIHFEQDRNNGYCDALILLIELNTITFSTVENLSIKAQKR